MGYHLAMRKREILLWDHMNRLKSIMLSKIARQRKKNTASLIGGIINSQTHI